MLQLFRIVLFVFIYFFLRIFSFLYAQEKLDGIAAVIGDEIILDSEIQEGFHNRFHEKATSKNRCKFFEEMLNNKILLYYAKKDPTLRINDQQIQLEVENIIKDFEKQANGKEALLKIYRRNTLNEIREEISTVIKNRQYIQEQYINITKNINASPRQIKNFYEKNKNRLPEIPEQFDLEKIVFSPHLTDIHRKKIVNQLKKIKEDILHGESFSTKAIANSQDLESAIDGGLIKGVQHGQMAKEFEKVAFSMQEGEISEPFETEYGFHILQLEKREKQKVDIRHILLKVQYTDEEIKNSKTLANSVHNLLIEKKISFEEAIKKYSDKKFNRGHIKNLEIGINRFEKSQLPIITYNHIVDLKEGEFSHVYEEEHYGYKFHIILKLLKRIPIHKISFLNDYQQLKNMTENYQKIERLRRWLREHINEVFIKIGKDYQNCRFENNWLKK